jgi:Flp pilus assembly protein TadD
MNDLIERYSRQLEQNPANHLARFSLGKALFDAGDFATAQDHFTQALAAKSDWMMAQILLGKCQLALGDKAAARESFRKARDLAIAQNHQDPREETEELLRELEA